MYCQQVQNTCTVNKYKTNRSSKKQYTNIMDTISKAFKWSPLSRSDTVLHDLNATEMI